MNRRISTAAPYIGFFSAFFSLCVLILFSSHVQAQTKIFPTAADNPTWKVGIWQFWTGGCQSAIWKYGDAVDACGHHYNEVLECDYNATNCQLRGYVRTEGAIVYVRKTLACTEQDNVLYNFRDSSYAMTIGTELVTTAWENYSAVQEYFGIQRLSRNIFYYADPPANNFKDQMTIIEGIGSDVHPFFALTCFGDFCETNLQTMEYREHDSILFLKAPRFPLPCKFWTDTITSVQEDTPISLGISPNPCTHILTIATGIQASSVDVYNSIGMLLFKVKLSEPQPTLMLDVQTLPPGVYMVYISNKEHLPLRQYSFIKE